MGMRMIVGGEGVRLAAYETGRSSGPSLLKVIKTTAAINHARVIPQARLVLLPGIGHSPFMEDSERFNAELTSFCAGLNNPRDAGDVGKQPVDSRPT